MIVRIRHTTRFTYDKPAYESHNEVRLTPRNEHGQQCLSLHLDVTPQASVLAYDDAYGNRVHSISVHPPHEELAIVAESVVDRQEPATERARDVAFAEFLGEDDERTRAYHEFLSPSAYVPFSERLRKFFWSARPSPTEGVVEYTTRLVAFVRDQFEYEVGMTDVHSSVDDILQAGGGVCQDFAHLTIGLLRLAGVPTRYVSGYLAPVSVKRTATAAEESPPGANSVARSLAGEQATHAWIEALLPGSGWTGLDPTHRGRVSERHIAVAIGRDYADVPPLRGVYRSLGSTQSMRVDVCVEEASPGEGAGERAASDQHGQSQQ